MATGIVSIAAADHGVDLISDGLIIVAAVGLPVLIVMVAREWRGFDFHDPNVSLGLFTYVAACAVVAARLAEHHIDSWILMGGAAIGTLAGDHLHRALLPGPFADGVRVVTIVTWVVATLWLAPLAYATIRRFAGIGWPTVFPLGMYSSATYAMYVETGWYWLTAVSLAFFWIALAAWIIVAVGSLTEFRRSRAADTPSGPTT
jgi:tellurite resistance protein TehA-like permease